MQKFLQAAIINFTFLMPIYANSITPTVYKIDTTIHKTRLQLLTDPTYIPCNNRVKALLSGGVLSALVGGALFYFFVSTSNIGIDILTILVGVGSLFGGALLFIVGLVLWLNRWMTSVNRQRRKDGQKTVNWSPWKALVTIILGLLGFISLIIFL